MDKNGDLTLAKADLTTPGAFDDIVKGCEIVFHTASPFVLTVEDPQRDLVDPAVKGTKSVLDSCMKDKGIKKVIVTSSVAAITDAPKKGHVYTENDWNTESSLKRNPYYYSKTLAEKAAWEYEKDAHFKILVVNPFVVIGPELNPNLTQVNTSHELFVQILNGEIPALIDLSTGFVDVRDVAAAHILVAEKETEGRHILWNTTLSMKDLASKMESAFPQYSNKIPHRDLTCSVGTFMTKMGSYFQASGVGQMLRTNLGTFPVLSHEKIQSLGLEFRDIDTTIRDTVQTLIDHNQLKQ